MLIRVEHRNRTKDRQPCTEMQSHLRCAIIYKLTGACEITIKSHADMYFYSHFYTSIHIIQPLEPNVYANQGDTTRH